MRIKRKFFFLLITVFVFIFALSGCYDLGEGTEDDEEYCANYSDIRLIDSTADIHSFSMEDFYNKKAVNDFESPMSEEDRDEFSYILIKSENTLSLGEIAIYFESTVKATVYVNVFIMNEEDIPTKVYTGEGGSYQAGECDEPSPSSSLTDVSFRVEGVKNKWTAFYLKSWGKDGARVKRQTIQGGQYLVFRIANNCSDPAKLELDKAKAAWQAILADFEAKAANLTAVTKDPSATEEDKTAAKTAYDLAAAAKAEGEVVYNAAVKKYEAEKAPEMTRVPFRITAVLIHAD